MKRVLFSSLFILAAFAVWAGGGQQTNPEDNPPLPTYHWYETGVKYVTESWTTYTSSHKEVQVWWWYESRWTTNYYKGWPSFSIRVFKENVEQDPREGSKYDYWSSYESSEFKNGHENYDESYYASWTTSA